MATKDRETPHHLSKDAAAPVLHTHTDETILARCLRLVIEKGPTGWLPWVAGIALVAATMTAIGAYLNRPPAGMEAWTDLMSPPPLEPGAAAGYEKFPQRIRPLLIAADRHPNTPASRWARLRAGLGLYEEGLRDLPNQKETGRPLLEEAIKQFDAVLTEAPADAPEAEFAAMGKARALESRGDLDQAIEQYEQVAAKWPTGANAKLASERAARLATPEAREFYENFYTLDFSKVGTSSGGLGASDLLSIPGLRGGSGSSLFGEPAIPPLGGGVPAGAVETPTPESPAPTAPPATEPAPAPSTDPPKEPLAAPAAPGDATPSFAAPAPTTTDPPAATPNMPALAPAPGP